MSAVRTNARTQSAQQSSTDAASAKIKLEGAQRPNEVREEVTPHVSDVDTSEIKRSSASRESTEATPSYGSEVDVEEKSQAKAASPVAQAKQQQGQSQEPQRQLDDRVKNDMLTIAAAFGTLPKRISDLRGAPSSEDVAAAEQVLAEDSPLPNESTRRDQFGANQISMAKAAEDQTLQDIGLSRVDLNRQKDEQEEQERIERYENAASEARTVRRNLQKQFAESNSRIKPSIYQRAVNFVKRKRETFSNDLAPSHRPTETRDKVKKSAKNSFNNEGTGYRIYGKMVALPTLDLREIGVGVQEIIAVIEQDPTMLDNLLKSSLSDDDLLNFNSTRIMRTEDVVNLINNNYVEVFTCKPPDNRGQDMQRRRLKVLTAEQRGIYLHPSMAAMYTADYDGDDMQISLDPSMRKQAKDPMEQLIGIDGEQSLDTAFLHVSFIRDGWDTGKNAKDYVNEIILHKFSKRKMNSFEKNAFNKVLNAVVELSRTTYLGSDEQAVAWGDFFRAAREFADINAAMYAQSKGRKISVQSSNRTMSDIITSVCNGFRNITAQTTLLTIGEIVPRSSLPEAFTPADSALYDLIDGMVLGAVPNNFQELKVMMNGFMGNVSGKSAPFRFTADVGKMMKLDTRFVINETGEFEYDPDDEAAMTDLLQKTVKYAYSERMAVEIKSNGKQMNLMETVKRNVIKDVGFLDDTITIKDANGNDVDVMRYANLTQFLEAFIDSYNRNAAMANEANLVFLTNMGIKIDENRKAINTIKNSRSRGDRNRRFSGVRFVDIATPFIDVYGNYSFNRMFGKYQHTDKYDITIPEGVEYRKFWSKTNKTVRGNEDWGTSVSGGSRWVRGVYGPMSIKAFSVNNRIVLTRDTEKNIHRNTLYNTNNAMDSFIAAIADKRTSTSSNYNTKVVGSYRGNNGNRSHVSSTVDNGKKTVVATTCEILKDIRNSNLEGTLLMPGFYAGIGSTDAPEEVLAMATEIAKELSQKQFCLRSGHAAGMDAAFEAGAGGNANVYMPYEGYNSNQKKGGFPVNGRAVIFDAQTESDRNAAEESVLRYHPAGKRLRQSYLEGEANKPENGDRNAWREYGKKTGAYKMHRRNYFQIFGTESEHVDDVYGVESAFVVCYDADGGGTAQAMRIAQDRNIPIFNAADYENLEDWKADVLDAADKCLQGQLYRTTSFDQMLHVDDAVMAINATGYELFHDLNMDSTAGFLMSPYGRAMIRQADNPDVVAGIRAAMVFKQQTQQISKYVNQIEEIDFDEIGSLSRWMYLYDQAKFAIDELSDKSLVWNGIIKELLATSSSDNKSYTKAFDVLRSERRKNRAGKIKGMEYWNADDFWTSESYDERFSSLKDVIEDLDMPWPLKCDIITDVVRWQLNDPRIQPFEIMYQMEVGSDSRYSVNGSPKAAMQVWKDTSSASNRYANYSLRNLRREVKEASDLYRDEVGALRNTIHNLATNPHLLVHVEDSVYADAILAVRDKLYPQTEKAKKHPWTNFIYSALSYQRNGGYFNDVYRYDDRVLGLQHKSQLSPADILRILDDPSYYLCVYDDYGSINYLDQQGLLGIDHEASEREIWDWLNENPRIAATILRQGIACVSTDTTGEGRVNSRTSISETITNMKDQKYDTLGNVKYLMRDHPVFAGIVSLLNPAHGTSTRNERNRVPQVEKRVCAEIYSAAKNGYGAHTVMNNLGITRQKLLSLLVNDFDKYMAHLGFGFDRDSIGEAREEASDIYETIMRHVQNYIDEVSQNVKMDNTIDASSDPLSMDVESLASFWDTIQEFSGAKVGVSTGIEGSETYRLSYWVSHMGAKDGYADLKAIEESLRNSKFDDNWRDFDGAWTNKGTFAIRWTENGIKTNLKQLQALCSSEAEEIIIKVPEGFQVPDRSTDSYGKQVPSLYVSMVSKRSNGAEKFNLKAMKAGLDGTDSVTKMRNKYITETFKDQYGNDKEYPIFFFEIRNNLQEIASREGIDSARMKLAEMMRERDQEMGYKDLTLANYMSIAEILLIEGENGEIILRSLEQIVAGVKGRIGCRIDEMTSKQVMNRIREIMYDTSDQGIGVSLSSNQYEMLSELRPRNTAGKSPSVNPMRVQSSVFSRNYDLLNQIREENSNVTMLTSTEIEEIHDSIVGPNSNIEDIKSIWDRSDILRNYSVIGYYGSATKGKESNLKNSNIGPSTAIVIGPSSVDSKRLLGICNACYKRGTTVIISFESVKSIPSQYIKDAIPIDEYGDMMIPMFDMRLNGSESNPFQSRFGIFRAEFGRYVISAEDPYNVFNLGDAQYKFTRSLVNRLSAHDSGNVALTAVNMFPNVFKNPEYKNCTFEVGMAKRDIIEDLILSQNENGEISPRCTIDYGLVEGAKGWDQKVHDVNKAIRRYAEMISDADDDGVLRGVELKPGDIVGWAQINIYENGKTTRSVLAPLIPFQLSGANKVPESFSVVQAGKENNDGSLMSIDWSYNKKLVDGFIKYFDSSGGANKGMISLTDIIEDSMRLKNGMELGAYCASASTDSRKIGTDRRIKTMISLMAIARMTGYNFARTKDAFPDNPEIKEELSNNRLPIDFWKQYYAGNDIKPLKFCEDKELSSFLNHECKKIFDDGGNPSDYLATTFTGELDDTSANEHVMWEFECMFENSLYYEDMLLRYLNHMIENFCPSSTEDATEDTLFRLHRENGDLSSGFDKGVLQMKVPYPTMNGNLSYIWSNVYVGMSFFGEDWSGNSRPNVRGASDTLDAENTNSYYGMELSKEKFRLRGTWSTAELARPYADSGSFSALSPYVYNWLG